MRGRSASPKWFCPKRRRRSRLPKSEFKLPKRNKNRWGLRNPKLTRRIIMILYRPRILPLLTRSFEPLTRLHSILSTPHKRNNSLLIEAPCIIDGLQEYLIQLILLGSVFRRSTGRFVNRFKCHLAPFTRQLCSNLIPKTIESFFDRRDIGIRLSNICPDPTVMVHIDNSVETARRYHVYDIRYTLQPHRVDRPGW